MKFFNKFDKKRLAFVGKLTFIFIGLVLIINLLGVAYSKYESSANVEVRANAAFFVVDVGSYESSISLEGLEPSTTPYYYEFYVSNYKDNKRANVDLNYNVNLEVTTNLPLEYELVCNEDFTGNYTNLLSNPNTITNSDGMYFKKYNLSNDRLFTHNSNQTDEYILKVTFPVSYKNNPDLYQGVIDAFTIIINAEQVA